MGEFSKAVVALLLSLGLAAPVTAGQSSDGVAYRRSPAQHHLGHLYGCGLCLVIGKDDDVETAKWHRTASEQGSADPQNQFAACGLAPGTRGIRVGLREGGPAYTAAMVAAAEEIDRAESERINGGGDYTIKAAFVGRGRDSRTLIVLFEGNRFCGTGGCTINAYRYINDKWANLRLNAIGIDIYFYSIGKSYPNLSVCGSMVGSCSVAKFNEEKRQYEDCSTEMTIPIVRNSPPTPEPEAAATTAVEQAARGLYFNCLHDAAVRIDDRTSDVSGVALAVKSICEAQFDSWIDEAGKGLSFEAREVMRENIDLRMVSKAAEAVMQVRASRSHELLSNSQPHGSPSSPPPLPVAGTLQDALAAYGRADYTTAFGIFHPFADQGNAHAQMMLGLMYSQGQGVVRDDAEAAKWFHRGADQGQPSAQYFLGRFYSSGRGISKDDVEAAKWYRKAADQGYPDAEFSLGYSYFTGSGISKDDVEAAKWYRKAADQGNADGQLLLGMAYLYSMGLPQDYVQAYKWCDLAASNPASKLRHVATAARDDAATKLNPAQITQAREFVSQWRATTISRVAIPSPVPSAPPAPPKVTEESSGTGYAVDDMGSVVTNRHVIVGCTSITVRRGEQGATAALVASDESNDLAVIKSNFPGLQAVRFRDGRGIRPADAVVAMGYPYAGLLANTPQVTMGTVTALAGVGDDSRLLQITAPIQPGNSGGPLFDLSGNVVGTIVSTLDPLIVAKVTGSLPQNVNFAIKAGIVRAFLDSKGIAYLSANSTTRMDPPDVSEVGAKSVVMVKCTR